MIYLGIILATLPPAAFCSHKYGPNEAASYTIAWWMMWSFPIMGAVMIFRNW